MAVNMKLVGAVAIKVRPDTSGFRRDAEKDIKQQLAGRDVDFKVKAKVSADTSELKRDVERAKQSIEKKRFDIRVGLDYDSVKKAQAQVKAAMDDLNAKEINVKFNEKGLAKAQAKLDRMMRDAKVKVEWVNDAAGFQSVLEKIAQIRREKITQTIEFATDEASLLTQEKFARAMLRQLGVDIKYTNDESSIKKAIAQLDAELDKFDEHTLNVRLDRDSLVKEKARLEAELNRRPVNLKVDYDDQASLKRARERIDSLLSDMKAVDLNVNVSQENLERERHKIDSFINDEEDKKINLPVGLTGLAAVSARLAYASRTRHVSFLVTINKKSLAVAEGLLRSLAGLNALRSTGRFLESLITGFDQIAIKGAAWTSAILSISNSLVYMLTSLFSIGGGMAKMVGLLATLPAIASALTAAVIINVMAFKNFKKAIDGDVEALAGLPPAAAAAARSLTGVWTSMQKPVQEAFWTTMGTSIQDFVEHVIPQLREGLVSVAPHAGAMLSNVLKAFTKLAVGGDMKVMFSNLARSFEITALAAEPLVDAINTLGLRGSYFLPRMAQWLTDITVRFDNWIQKSEKAGDINRWIEEGIAALRGTWEAGGAVVNMFRALARSANDAGAGGLLAFRDNMQSIADTMLGEPFRTRMALFFQGSRDGASYLNEGIRALGDTFGRSAYWVDRFLIAIGQLSGDALIQLSRVFGNVTLQSGLLDAVRGMQTALTIMTPGFDHLGTIIGNLGVVASKIFTSIAPVINTVMRIVGNSLDGLTGSMTKLIPMLTTLVNGILVVFEGPFGTIVNIVAALVDGLSLLPGVVQSIVISLIGMFLLRGQFAPFFLSISNGFARMAAAARGDTSVIVNAWGRHGIVARTVATGVATSAASIMATNQALMASYGRSATSAAAAGAATVAAFNAAAAGTTASFMRTSAAVAAAAATQTLAMRAPAAAAAANAAALGVSNEAAAASAQRLAARMLIANAEIAAGASIGARGVTAAAGVMRAAYGTVAGSAALAATGVQTAMTRIAASTATGAAAATRGAAGIGKAFMALTGGWVGIAIIGIGTALAVLGSQAAAAKAKTDALAGSLDELGNTTSATDRQLAQMIIDDNMANFFTNIDGSVKSASEAFGILGIKIGDAARIAAEGGAEYDLLLKNLKELDRLKSLEVDDKGKTIPAAIQRSKDFAQAAFGSAAAADLNRQSIQHLADFYGKLRDPLTKAITDTELMNDKMAEASPRTIAWNDALKVLNDTTSTSSRRVEALKDALDILNGKSVDSFKITRNYNDRVRDMQGFLQDATKATEGLNDAQAKADVDAKRRALNATVNVNTGEISTTTDLGSDLSKQLEGLQDTAIEVAIRLKDDGSVAKATESLKVARDNWISMASQAGISAEAAGKAWDTMIGGIPSDIATALAVTGVDEAGNAVTDFGNSLALIDGRKAIAKIVGDDQDLAQKIIDSSTSLDEFDATVATATADLDITQAQAVRDQMIVELANMAATDPTIKANMDPALFEERRAVLLAQIAELDRKRPNPVVNAQIDEAQRQLAIVDKALGITDGKRPTPKVGANTSEANAKITSTDSSLDALNTKVSMPSISLLGSSNAVNGIDWVRSNLNSIDGKTATTYVVTRISSINDGNRGNAGGPGGQGGPTMANGGIFTRPGVRAMANGGISPKPTSAHIAPAGSYVLYAERETGGEAFIPLSAAKRNRSTAILKNVADRFGYELRKQANGSSGSTGGSSTPAAPTGVNFNIASIVAVDTEAAVQKLRTSQMDALAVAGISNGGAL